MKTTDIIIIIIIVLISLIIEALVISKKQDNETIKNNEIKYYPYKKKYLLTKAEYVFYNKLKEKCDLYNFLICPKVRLEDFIEVTDKENKRKYRGYIKSRHVDFVICDNKLNIIACIELDDNSHNKEKVKIVDDFKNSLFESIKLPLIRIKMSEGNYEKQIENAIDPFAKKKKINTEHGPIELDARPEE